ncbi:MAG: SAM-dependent methyltransferase, partial [Prevotella sp.]|nr:SAM-dependent methyltransferase [Prevotella sp.]
MAEAVEIAKLRLFLKMVAVVEVDKRVDNMGLDPLPDIDFNIRCGNTLVGYSTEEHLYHDLDIATDFLQQLANQDLKDQLQAKLNDVADTYEVFRLEQLSKDADVSVLKQAKQSLNKELDSLNDLLNRHLYAASGYSDYDKWLALHQPFHWLAEFYQIMHGANGFDVVIGNPPYVEYPSEDVPYSFNRLLTAECGNLYGCCTERALSISQPNGRFSFIVPVAITCSKRMTPVISLIKEKANMALFANFDDRPGKLFEMLQHLRATVFIVDKRADASNPRFFATKYNRWYSECRNILFG